MTADAKGGRQATLVTGATGLIGHHVLAHLLRSGRRCAVLLRSPLSDTWDRLSGLLWELGFDADGLRAATQLIPLEGSLGEGVPALRGFSVRSVVHAAASTRFNADGDGDPWRTNVDGTQNLLDWASAAGAREFHYVGSAYACGRTAIPVAEAPYPSEPEFHNDYERSKWHAERLCMRWAQADGRSLTVFRPSVVVGEYASGRSTRFAGIYLLARATELLDRTFRHADESTRRSIPLRIRARADESQNIVPVDYVGRVIAAIVAEPEHHGRVYHVTNGNPPSNRLFKEALEQFFGIGGGRFVEAADFPRDDLNEHEQRFYDASRSIEHYFVDSPTFDRSHTAGVEQRAGIACPAYDCAALGRLFAYAQSANWGRPRGSRFSSVPGCSSYFESFLPSHVGRSRIARMTALSATIRFVIDDELDGCWTCRFERGRLAAVRRGWNDGKADFGYRSTKEVFWEAISGTTHPQELFLSGRAELFGDIEAALKMAMILHDFTKEFPCLPLPANPSAPAKA